MKYAIGYSQRQLELDERMVALGRPPPPVTAWLEYGARANLNTATASWRERLAKWEQLNPAAAEEWQRLFDLAEADQEELEKHKWDSDAFNYELLNRLGAPRESIEAIRRRLDDRFCFRAAREWCADGTSWCLALLGGPGAGKTTAAAWAAHQLMIRDHRPQWIRCAAMVDAPMWGVGAEALKRKCRGAGVLVLDDIGAGAREADAKPWLGWLDDILDARAGNSKKTIITSNKRPGELADWLGLRIADRLNTGTIKVSAEASMRRPERSREPGEEG